MVNSIYSSRKEKCIIPLKSSATDGRFFISSHHSQEKHIFPYTFIQENLLNSKIYCNFAANFEKEIKKKSKIK